MERKKILLASNNDHKVKEINNIIKLKKLDVEIVPLKSLGINNEIPETGSTLEENAMIKCKFLHSLYPKMPVISEDTGLEVFTLGYLPGVHTARYAGPAKNPIENMNKLLSELKNQEDRRARFRTVIAYLEGTTQKTFEGIVEGEIASHQCGTGGFGYDPIFIPYGYDRTFAELDQDIKNNISHRAKAFEKLIDYLLTKTHTTI